MMDGSNDYRNVYWDACFRKYLRLLWSAEVIWLLLNWSCICDLCVDSSPQHDRVGYFRSDCRFLRKRNVRWLWCYYDIPPYISFAENTTMAPTITNLVMNIETMRLPEH